VALTTDFTEFKGGLAIKLTGVLLFGLIQSDYKIDHLGAKPDGTLI
jgi:hypothetical protein